MIHGGHVDEDVEAAEGPLHRWNDRFEVRFLSKISGDELASRSSSVNLRGRFVGAVPGPAIGQGNVATSRGQRLGDVLTDARPASDQRDFAFQIHLGPDSQVWLAGRPAGQAIVKRKALSCSASTSCGTPRSSVSS